MFDSLVGNQRVKELLRGMLRRGNVPGALLFTGPDGVGKKLFALQMARAAVCIDTRDGEACDTCAACVRVTTFHPPKESDKDANKKVTRTSHPDVVLVRNNARILPVDQIREVEREAQFRPFEGRARYFIVDDADKMNPQASNALLKTLEEPSSTTHIILITERPGMLLDTIRSRSQLVRFTPIELAEIKENLATDPKIAPDDVNLLAGLAAGSLGRARSLDLEKYRGQRELMLAALTSASITPDRSRLLRVAEELNDAKRKEEFEDHLEALETLAADVLRLSVDERNAAIVNDDLRRQLREIAERVPTATASAWIQQIETMRGRLKVNINRKVASDALFLDMMVTV
jgi:DNA polymerase-3 subunit delta'